MTEVENVRSQIPLLVTVLRCLCVGAMHRSFGMIHEDKLLHLSIGTLHDAAVVLRYGVEWLREHLDEDIAVVVSVSLDEVLYVALSQFEVQHRTVSIAEVKNIRCQVPPSVTTLCL